jgi:hypothetical protein
LRGSIGAPAAGLTIETWGLMVSMPTSVCVVDPAVTRPTPLA